MFLPFPQRFLAKNGEIDTLCENVADLDMFKVQQHAQTPSCTGTYTLTIHTCTPSTHTSQLWKLATNDYRSPLVYKSVLTRAHTHTLTHTLTHTHTHTHHSITHSHPPPHTNITPRSPTHPSTPWVCGHSDSQRRRSRPPRRKRPGDPQALIHTRSPNSTPHTQIHA